MQYTPYTPQSYPVPQGQTNIIWVENEDEARIRTRQLFPNSIMIMLDHNQPRAYRCFTDMSGRAHPVEVFDLVPHVEETLIEQTEEPEETHQISMEEYIQQQDNRIAQLEAQIKNMSRPVEIVDGRRRRKNEN